METKKAVRKMKELIPEIEKISTDEETAENLRIWMSGYMERAKLERRLKEKKGRKIG